MFGKIQSAARKAVQVIGNAAKAVVTRLTVAAAGLAAITSPASATIIDDADALVDAAQTTFEAVAAVVILVLGFTLVVKFVKKLRGA